MHLRKAIEEAFGLDALQRAVFYAHPGGLRFELSEGGAPLDQVLTALGKATPICDHVFGGTDSVLVCLRHYAQSSRFAHRKFLSELALTGISIPNDREIWLDSVSLEERYDENVEEWWANIAFHLPKTKLQNLLWCALVSDFGPLRPNPHCLVYLFNLTERVMVHPYDDRGMDIIGSNHRFLQRLFHKFNKFLLDYDRAAMNATFIAPEHT